MTYRIASLLAVLSLVLSCAPSSVLAQALTHDDEDVRFDEAEQTAAKRAFKDGRDAFDSGHYERALERFEHAYALSHKSALLFNIGLAADRFRDDERALEAFEQYLAQTPESEHRDEVQMRVVALREAEERKKAQVAQQRDAQASKPRDGRARDDVPSPAEVAAASVHDDDRAELTTSRSERDDEGSVLSTWWFWTGAAVLAAAGGVTAYVLLQPDEQPELPQPNTTVTVQTLRLAP